MASDLNILKKELRQHGLEMRPLRGAHVGIFKGEKRIYTMGSSPKNSYEASQNTVRDLVLAGYLPDGLIYRGRIYKRKRKAKRLYD